MKVIVIGSRELSATGRVKVYGALDALLLEAGQLDVSVGDCPTGADYYALNWAKRSVEAWPSGVVRLRVYCADWSRLGGRAGPERNVRMVADGADLCIAFYEPGGGNRGTAGCVALARTAGIKVHEYTGDPS